MTSKREIEEKREDLETLESAYLNIHGWSHTCVTPGSYWMWRRDFSDLDEKRKATELPGRTTPLYGVLTVDKDTALRITMTVLDLTDEDDEEE